MDNGVSTADDFKKSHQEEVAKEAKQVTLPSGKKVMMYQPSPDWWARHTGTLPQGLAAKASLQADQMGPELTQADIVDFARRTVELVSEIVVSPKIRINPGLGEVDPRWISDKDWEFINRYGRGEITADGLDLDQFPGRTVSVVAGQGGEGSESKT